MKPFNFAVAAGLAVATFAAPAAAIDITGAGATFPYPVYSKWAEAYKKETGNGLNYQSIGSGGGIKSIQDQTVDFGATDGPMTEEQMEQAGGGAIHHIPAALGAVVATYNIPEVQADTPLRFTSETLPAIFLGEITTWNDPLLVADNPSLENVDQDIITVHRSDGSGTTFIFTDYLSTVNEEWETAIGNGTSVNWPGGLGASGNEGVAGQVSQTPYSIGYVEFIYAEQNDLGVAEIQNQEGNWIEPTTASVSAAAQGISETIADDLRASIVDAPGDDTYPIAGFTWLLAYEEQTDEAKAIALTRMLWWAVTDAQEFNADLGYAPIPDGIVTKAQDKIRSITVNGQPAFPEE